MESRYGKQDQLIIDIQKHCIEHHLTLSLAESCTGGQLAAQLTKVAGCSAYFVGSIVAYSNRIKKEILGVKEEALKTHGAVSSQVVAEMAKGVLTITGSDYSIAVTGIAGPGGGEKNKPVGTVWAAIAHRGDEPLVWSLFLQGSRKEVIDQTVEAVLVRFAQVIRLLA